VWGQTLPNDRLTYYVLHYRVLVYYNKNWNDEIDASHGYFIPRIYEKQIDLGELQTQLASRLSNLYKKYGISIGLVGTELLDKKTANELWNSFKNENS
jgi:hypothetical protein